MSAEQKLCNALPVCDNWKVSKCQHSSLDRGVSM